MPTRSPAVGAAPRKRTFQDFDAAVHLWPHIDTSGGTDACHPWVPGPVGSNQYGRIFDCEGFPAPHRKAWEEHNGIKLRKYENVLHKCNNRLCCNGRHLYKGTRKQNAQDAINAGHKFGVRKLNAEKAREIYALKGTGLRHADVAPHYGVTPNTIQRIWNGLRWASATGFGKGKDARSLARRVTAQPERRIAP